MNVTKGPGQPNRHGSYAASGPIKIIPKNQSFASEFRHVLVVRRKPVGEN